MLLSKLQGQYAVLHSTIATSYRHTTEYPPTEAIFTTHTTLLESCLVQSTSVKGDHTLLYYFALSLSSIPPFLIPSVPNEKFSSTLLPSFKIQSYSAVSAII
jgi:hypothetical protein